MKKRKPVERKKKNDGIDDIFTPHATSFNSSGDINSNGRPSGTINRGNEVNEEKTEYDKNYQKSKIK